MLSRNNQKTRHQRIKMWQQRGLAEGYFRPVFWVFELLMHIEDTQKTRQPVMNLKKTCVVIVPCLPGVFTSYHKLEHPKDTVLEAQHNSACICCNSRFNKNIPWISCALTSSSFTASCPATVLLAMRALFSSPRLLSCYDCAWLSLTALSTVTCNLWL
jgi:hypothetical protein